MSWPDIDDVDRLFARLQRRQPPAQLVDEVLAAVAARARTRRRVGQSAVAVALALAAGLSFFVGQALRTSGALALVGVAVADLEIARAAPLEVGMALVELIPWGLASLVALSLATVIVAGRFALTPLVDFTPPRLGE